MKSKLFFIAILCMIFESCAKENIVDTRVYVDIPGTMIGNWNWLSTSGGIGVSLYTPENTGEIRRVEFDNKSNFRYYVNDILKSDHTFRIEKSKSITGNDSALIAYNLLSSRQNIMFRGTDTLILFDECYDCYEHYFIRIK